MGVGGLGWSSGDWDGVRGIETGSTRIVASLHSAMLAVFFSHNTHAHTHTHTHARAKTYCIM